VAEFNARFAEINARFAKFNARFAEFNALCSFLISQKNTISHYMNHLTPLVSSSIQSNMSSRTQWTPRNIELVHRMLEKDNADIREIARVTKLSKRSIYKFIQVISSSFSVVLIRYNR